MGSKSSTEAPAAASRQSSVVTADPELDQVKERVVKRAGLVAVSGRYHNERQLEDDYDIVKDPSTGANKVLGSGYNGQVLMASHKGNKHKYAVKQFKLAGCTTEQKQELKDECEIYLAMDHPHIVRLVDCYESVDYLSLVMECMEGGELFKRVLAQKVFTEKIAAIAVHQMLLAVNYLHSNKTAHRDLKLENFLYESESTDNHHLKLIDFGFSKICEDGQRMKLSCGTLSYVAPEVLRKNYDLKCDMWSMGIITFILLAGYMPFYGKNDEQIAKIKAADYKIKPEKWNKVSKEGLQFVQSLIVVNPKERLSAEDALNHHWITSRIGDRKMSEVDGECMLQSIANFAAASEFKKQVMQVMAWSLTNEERSQVRDAFILLDEDNSGRIKLTDLKALLKKDFDASPEILKSMDALDTDHDDDIEYSDFLSAMCATKIKMNDTLLKETFRRFDADNTGTITVENLKQVLNLEGDEAGEAIRAADKNGDGKIQLEEFIAYVTSPNISHAEMERVTGVIDRETSGDSQPSSLPTVRSKRRSAEA